MVEWSSECLKKYPTRVVEADLSVSRMKSMLVSIPGHALCVVELEDEKDLVDFLYKQYGLLDYWLDHQPDSEHVRIRLRLPGGKGGFGSNLRAQGNKMSARKRSGGNDACRDLSGRRLRTLNETRLIQEYLRREPEMERRREAEIREKMIKDSNAVERRPVFEDVKYMRTMQETVDGMESAIYQVMMENDSEDESTAEKSNDLDHEEEPKVPV